VGGRARTCARPRYATAPPWPADPAGAAPPAPKESRRISYARNRRGPPLPLDHVASRRRCDAPRRRGGANTGPPRDGRRGEPTRARRGMGSAESRGAGAAGARDAGRPWRRPRRARGGAAPLPPGAAARSPRPLPRDLLILDNNGNFEVGDAVTRWSRGGRAVVARQRGRAGRWPDSPVRWALAARRVAMAHAASAASTRSRAPCRAARASAAGAAERAPLGGK